MKKIVFICPYFGKLPASHMDLWLQSCEKNPTIDWLVFADDKTKFNYPKNVKVKYLSFNDLEKKVQKKFDFPICLKNAYKLCDFKPTYGYIFSEYIKNYDFWGYCDMSDCIFGNIRHFITDKILDKYDKIGFLGHLTLFKNCKDVNERFMLNTNSNVTFKDVLSSNSNMAFDELRPYSINAIYNHYGFPSCRIDDYYYDISPMTYPFRQSIYDDRYMQKYLKRIPTIFSWKSGKLFKYYITAGKLCEEELLYVHFQKRNMKKTFTNTENEYFIIPNEFTTNVNLDDLHQIRKITRFKIYPRYFDLKFKALKYRVKKLLGIN